MSAPPVLCAGSQSERPADLYGAELFALLAHRGLDVAPQPPVSAGGELESRIQELKDDIARRVRPLIGAIPEDEFETLVDQMARIQFKYEAMEHERVVRTPPPWEPGGDDRERRR